MPGTWPSSSTEPKPPCSLAVLEDRAGHPRADAVELVELLGRGGVEVERRALAGRRRRGAADGHDDLAPVLELRGEVERGQVGPAAGAAGAAHRVDHPRARGQPVDARPAHRAGHVHGQARGGLVRLRDADRRPLRPAVIPPEVARAQQHDRHEAERPQGEDVARGLGHDRRR